MNRIPREELVGQPVLVDSSGQIGIIIRDELENDSVMVDFRKEGMYAISTDSLLLLKPFDEIAQNLQTHQDELSTDEYKALFQISLLQGFEQTIGNISTAIAIAMQSPRVSALSLRTLHDAIEPSRDSSLGR